MKKEEIDALFNEHFGNEIQTKKDSIDIDALYNEHFGSGNVSAKKEDDDYKQIPEYMKNFTTADVDGIDALIASFATDNIQAAEYLSKKYPDSDFTIDKNNLFKDGKKVDLNVIPKEALPFVGQVLGSIGGAAVGGGATPVGVATGFAGGVGGATAGRWMQMAIGSALGLDYDSQEINKEIAETVGSSAIGEVIGFGIVHGVPAAGKVLLKTPAGQAVKERAKAVGKGIQKALKPIGKFGEEVKDSIVKIIFRLDKNMVKEMKSTAYNGKRGVDAVIEHPSWSDRSFLEGVANVVIFGSKSAPAGAGVKAAKEGFDMAIPKVLENAKATGQGCEEILKVFGGISDDAAKTAMSTPTEKLLSPNYVSGNWADAEAKNIANKLSVKAESIRQEMATRIDKTLQSQSKQVADIGDEVVEFLNNKASLPILKPAQGVGQISGGVPQVKGIAELDSLERMFMQDVNEGSQKLFKTVQNRFSKEIDAATKRGDTATVERLKNALSQENEAIKSAIANKQPLPVKYMEKKDLFNAWKQVDAVVERVNQDASIDSTVRATVNDFAKKFRGKAQRAFNVSDLSAKFSKLKQNSGDIIRDLSAVKDFGSGRITSFTQADALKGLSNTLRNLNESPINKQLIARTLSEIEGDVGSILKKIQIGDAAQQLSKLDTAALRNTFFQYINNPKNVLTEAMPRQERGILTAIDSIMPEGKKFMNGSKLFHLSRAIQNPPSENLLRLNTLASLLGGATGFAVGGTPGAALGFAGASALSTPTVFAGLLKGLGKASAVKKTATAAAKLAMKNKMRVPPIAKKVASATAKATIAKIARNKNRER
jgi:hypothetical protein